MSHLAAVIAIPTLVVTLFVAYHVGDYLDPDVPERTASSRFNESPRGPTLEEKVGRGLKQGALGVGALVGIPVIGILGLVLYVMANNKGGGGGTYYGD